MDTSPYSNYRLCQATVRLAQSVRRNNPELWAQIVKEAAQAEAAASRNKENPPRG